jgi:transposase InsO family protein
MEAWLVTQGHLVNRKRVQRLMRLLGLLAIYQRPNTSQAGGSAQDLRYLLGGLAIEKVNQVWCADVTYIPMARGFPYLVVMMNWASRVVLAWRLSNTLSADFCVAALEEALARYGRPEIFNTDQGSQFTSDDFIGILKRQGITISMDGKGRCMDNIFVERLWRSRKYEKVYRGAPAPEPRLSPAVANLPRKPVDMWTIGVADRLRFPSKLGKRGNASHCLLLASSLRVVLFLCYPTFQTDRIFVSLKGSQWRLPA